MDSFKTTIALTKLYGATLAQSPDGKKFIQIPIDDNRLFLSEQGGVYLTLVHWANRMPDQKGNTHSVKLSLPIDDPRTKESPILGGSKPLMRRNQPAQLPYAASQQAPFAQQQWQQAFTPQQPKDNPLG